LAYRIVSPPLPSFTTGRFKIDVTGSKRPILLKKWASVSAAEKYASEIEILNLRRGFQAAISRSSELKKLFHQPIFRQFGDSTAIRPPATDSTVIRPPIPRTSGHP
jgi:hypothetical protein